MLHSEGGREIGRVEDVTPIPGGGWHVWVLLKPGVDGFLIIGEGHLMFQSHRQVEVQSR